MFGLDFAFAVPTTPFAWQEQVIHEFSSQLTPGEYTRQIPLAGGYAGLQYALGVYHAVGQAEDRTASVIQ